MQNRSSVGFERTLTRAIEVLDGDGAVVVANPSPMTYGVVARDAHAVNLLKQRPVDQAVAISVHSAPTRQQVFRVLDVQDNKIAVIDFALGERISVLAPIRTGVAVPEWLSPAAQDGWLAFFDGSWAPLASLWHRFPFLYGSSANQTGEAPAASASEARRQFTADTVVVDADHLRTPDAEHGASTMIRVNPAGHLSLHRSGIQDRAAGGPKTLLDRLNETRASSTFTCRPGGQGRA
ncbi:Sua5/YciO/YrdC/YwlC family protein [Kribbella sp. NPDC051952]|uniref:Sua5/YciO/YrdC/YwlC family protein n=1 Tax=Kribbella sp. NPDC051952 TaxID=3154851 RepID=UPI0034254D20